jgi:serine/threonine-protein kinase
VTLGTFDYISPEQARDPRSADVRSDIYSLGCTLHYLLTGQPPFPSGNAMQKLLQHQGDEPPDLARLNPSVPEGFARIVRKMLAKDPRRRYQDARSLIVDLSLLCTHLGIEFPSAGITLLMPVVPRWRRVADRVVPWLVPAAALVVTVIVLDRIWANRFGTFEGWAPEVRRETDRGNSLATEGPAVAAKESGSRPKQPSAVVPTVSPEVVEPQGPSIEERPPPEPAGTYLAPGSGTGLKVAGSGELTPPAAATSGTHLAAKEAVASPNVSPPVAPARNVLVVDPTADGSRPYEFPTVKAAVEKLKGGGTIELRYTGRSTESPIKLAKLGNVLTIRAAEGHQPVLVFAPDTSSESLQMIALRDAQLKLINVALELVPPALSSRDSRWALVSLVRSSIDLQRCTLTCTWHGDLPDKVCFFQAEGDSPSGAMMMAMEMPGTEASPPSIQLTDCVARGGGEFVHAKVPVRIRWTNGLAALSDALFASDMPMQPRGSSVIELSHVTARLGRGLCSLAGSPQQETSISCNDCILLGSASGDAPLIQQQGGDTVTNLKNRLTWKGGGNLYELFPTRWRITSDAGQESMDKEAWARHWGSGEAPAIHDATLPLGWVRLNPQGPPTAVHEQVPRDFELRPESQASRRATDVGDIGFRIDDLPKPPPAHAADATPTGRLENDSRQPIP